MENEVKNEAVQDVTVTISGIEANDKPINIVRSADKSVLCVTNDGVDDGVNIDCSGVISVIDIMTILLGLRDAFGEKFGAAVTACISVLEGQRKTEGSSDGEAAE